MQAENRLLQDQQRLRQQQQEKRGGEEIREADTAPSSPALMALDFTCGASGTRNATGGTPSGQSPSTSTPSNPDDGSAGARRKRPDFDQDRSISGVISPIRGEIDQSYPAGTFYPWRTPVVTHDEFIRIILDEVQEANRNERKEMEEAEKKKRNEGDGDESEDDNHKEAGKDTKQGKGLFGASGSSLFERTDEETAPKFSVVVTNERGVEPFMLREDEDITRREPEPRVSKRKQMNPKKFTKK